MSEALDLIQTATLGQSGVLQVPPPIEAYLLTLWALDSSADLDGIGFPFDRAQLVFFDRINKAWESTFRDELAGAIAAKVRADREFKKMLKQINKYWDKLFADPILVATKNGNKRAQKKIGSILHDKGVANNARRHPTYKCA